MDGMRYSRELTVGSAPEPVRFRFYLDIRRQYHGEFDTVDEWARTADEAEMQARERYPGCRVLRVDPVPDAIMTPKGLYGLLDRQQALRVVLTLALKSERAA